MGAAGADPSACVDSNLHCCTYCDCNYAPYHSSVATTPLSPGVSEERSHARGLGPYLSVREHRAVHREHGSSNVSDLAVPWYVPAAVCLRPITALS